MSKLTTVELDARIADKVLTLPQSTEPMHYPPNVWSPSRRVVQPDPPVTGLDLWLAAAIVAVIAAVVLCGPLAIGLIAGVTQ